MFYQYITSLRRSGIVDYFIIHDHFWILLFQLRCEYMPNHFQK